MSTINMKMIIRIGDVESHSKFGNMAFLVWQNGVSNVPVRRSERQSGVDDLNELS